MKVDRFSFSNFMGHASGEWDIPSSGITTVTGPNGIGKSSFIEAVAVALSGKTLRKTPWWWEGQPSTVCVGFAEGLTIERTRSKSGKETVRISGVGQHETSKKATAWIEQSLPSREVWRRVCVFTSSALEGLTFTEGTSGEKTRLFEVLLGMDQLDAASSIARTELDVWADKVSRCSEALALLIQQRHRLREAMVRDRESLEAMAPPEVPEAIPVQLEAFRKKLSEVEEEVWSARSELQESRLQRRQVQDSQRLLERKEQVVRRSSCESCEQEVSEEYQTSQLKRIKDEQNKLTLDLDTIDLTIEGLQEEIEELEAARRERSREYEAHQAEVTRNKTARAEAERQKARFAPHRKRLGERIEEAQKEIEALDKREPDRLGDLGDAEHGQAIRAVTASVFGLRGVRSRLFAEALAAVGELATQFLARMGNLTLELQPFAEKKSGKKGETKDEITVLVGGVNHNHGYAGCSTGQRRRIDVACLLALATLAGEAHGLQDSTLFFDEVFDGLDPEGVQGVVEVLHEMAEKRSIVVITHNQELASVLRPKRAIQLG